MKQLALAGALALALSGCAEFSRFAAALTSPQATEATANIRTGATTFACALSDAAAIAGRIERAVNAGDAVIDTTGRVTTGSAVACTALGGVATAAGTAR